MSRPVRDCLRAPFFSKTSDSPGDLIGMQTFVQCREPLEINGAIVIDRSAYPEPSCSQVQQNAKFPCLMDQTPPVSETQSEPSSPARMSLFARLLNVFAIPGEVFDDVKSGGNTVMNWLAPAILIILIGWIGSTIVFSQESIRQKINELTDKGIEQQIAKGKMTEAQAEQARNIGAISVKVSIYAGPVVMAILTPFWWGFLIWLAGAVFLKQNVGFMQSVEVAGLSNMIMALDALVRTLMIILTGNLFAAPSLIMLVKDYDPQNPIHNLLALGNLMLLWLLCVRSVGLARLANVTFSKAATFVFGFWAAYTGLLMGIGIAFRKAFGG